MKQINIKVSIDVDKLLANHLPASIKKHVKMTDDQKEQTYLNHDESHLVSRVTKDETLRWTIESTKPGEKVSFENITVNDDDIWFAEGTNVLLPKDEEKKIITGTIAKNVKRGEICSYVINIKIEDTPIGFDPLIEVRL